MTCQRFFGVTTPLAPAAHVSFYAVAAAKKAAEIPRRRAISSMFAEVFRYD
jgi:hypothetical protein